MLTYYLTSFATAVSALILGIFVLYKNPGNRVNQTWFAMSVSVSLWSGFFVISIFGDDAGQSLLFNRICNIATLFIMSSFYHFSLAVTGRSGKKDLLLYAAYGTAVFIALFGFSPYFVPAMRPISIFPFYPTPGPLFHIYVLHFAVLFIRGEYILYQRLRSASDSRYANQIKYIMIATILGFITGGVSFLPVYDIPINPQTTHFIWLYVAIISYAIVKHRLMDIRVVIRKGLIYSILIALITLIYFALVFISGTLFQSYMGSRSILATALIFTVIALGFKPLERRLQDLVDRFIFKRTRKMLEAENQLLMDEMRKQDRMKGVATLAAGMAHEIKNPLTSIKTFAEYLPERYDDPEFRTKFKTIVGDEVDRINNIVKQLLEFAKPKPLSIRPASINDVIDGTLDLISNNLFKSSITVKRIYGNVGLMQLDQNQMRQVFLNLFLNSIQAMPSGGKLTIQTAKDNAGITIEVSDTGVGIPKEHLSRIFDPFYTTNDESGTGLGLAIVYGIIQEHGGEIKVKSSPGSTTFTIHLPIST